MCEEQFINMTEPEKLICNFVYEFVNKNWNKIDKNNCGIINTKKEFLEDLKVNTETACWVVMEVASWSMDKEYLREFFVKETEDLGFTILNINGKYLKLFCKTALDKWQVSFAEKKTKTVDYWT
jgi:hypothetical protein